MPAGAESLFRMPPGESGWPAPVGRCAARSLLPVLRRSGVHSPAFWCLIGIWAFWGGIATGNVAAGMDGHGFRSLLWEDLDHPFRGADSDTSWWISHTGPSRNAFRIHTWVVDITGQSSRWRIQKGVCGQGTQSRPVEFFRRVVCGTCPGAASGGYSVLPTIGAIAPFSSARLKKVRLRRRAHIQRSTTCTPHSTLALSGGRRTRAG